jgi:hypothetical protein
MRVEAVNSLGVSGAAIEVPWRGTDGDAYLDLREDPAAISQISAAREYSPLAGFLTVVNGAGSLFATVRAKVWEETTSQAGPEFTFHSRVDLMFARSEFNFISERYEDAVQRLVALWMKDTSGDALSVRMEILPCVYGDAKKEGAALRLTLTARSASGEQARVRWGLGIVRVQQALLFVSRAMRQKLGIDADGE